MEKTPTNSEAREANFQHFWANAHAIKYRKRVFQRTANTLALLVFFIFEVVILLVGVFTVLSYPVR